jgi:hypothetical protein
MRLIAMRATREEVESLGIELIKKNPNDFVMYNYLCNNENGEVFMNNKFSTFRINYETFNKQIFLEACGMRMPTLEEVKAYFKDAELVSCLFNGVLINPKDFTERGIHVFANGYWADCLIPSRDNILLWDKQNGYANIILTKAKKYEITKEQILKYKMKYEFPECFVKGYTIKEAEETFKIKIIEKL